MRRAGYIDLLRHGTGSRLWIGFPMTSYLKDQSNAARVLQMIRTKGLTHIHLIVRDMKRSLRFYKTVFGMRVSFKVGRKLVFLNTPGSKDNITLHEDPDLADVAGTSGGISHFGFELVKTDLDTAIREFEKAGGRLLEQGEHAPGVPYAYVADPDGYVIEL